LVSNFPSVTPSACDARRADVASIAITLFGEIPACASRDLNHAYLASANRSAPIPSVPSMIGTLSFPIGEYPTALFMFDRGLCAIVGPPSSFMIWIASSLR
jgi:hypothetical protein